MLFILFSCFSQKLPVEATLVCTSREGYVDFIKLDDSVLIDTQGKPSNIRCLFINYINTWEIQFLIHFSQTCHGATP